MALVVDILYRHELQDIQYTSQCVHNFKDGYPVRIHTISGSMPGSRSGYPGWGRGGGYTVHISGRSHFYIDGYPDRKISFLKHISGQNRFYFRIYAGL